MIKRWNNYWFSPEDAFNLAVCRILFFSIYPLLTWPLFSNKWPVTPWSISLWSEVDSFLWQPLGMFKWLGLFPSNTTFLVAGTWVLYVAMLFSALGLFTRVSTITAFFLNFYLMNLSHNFGKVTWGWQMPVFIIFIFACSKCGDALSLDKLLFRRGSKPAASGDYRWPIRAVWMMASLMYFSAGIAKFRVAGLDWMSPETLGVYLVRANYPNIFVAVNPWTDWGLWLAQQQSLIVIFSISTLIIEVGYPIAMFVPLTRFFFVPSAVGMHLSIACLIGAIFPQYQMTALFWIPWDRMIRFIRSRSG